MHYLLRFTRLIIKKTFKLQMRLKQAITLYIISIFFSINLSGQTIRKTLTDSNQEVKSYVVVFSKKNTTTPQKNITKIIIDKDGKILNPNFNPVPFGNTIVFEFTDTLSYYKLFRDFLSNRIKTANTKLEALKINKWIKKGEDTTAITKIRAQILQLETMLSGKEADKNQDYKSIFAKALDSIKNRKIYTIEYFEDGKWFQLESNTVSDSTTFRFRVVKTDVVKDFYILFNNLLQEEFKNDLPEIIARIKKNRMLVNDMKYELEKSRLKSIMDYIINYFPAAESCKDSCCLKSFNKCELITLNCYIGVLSCLLAPTQRMEDLLVELYVINGGEDVFTPLGIADEDDFNPTPEIRRLFFDNADSVNAIIENKRRFNELIQVKSVITESYVVRKKTGTYGEIRNYDFSLTDKIDETDFKEEYPNDYIIKIAGHNIPDDVTPALKWSTESFTEQSFFAKEVLAEFEKLDILKSNLIVDPLKIELFKDQPAKDANGELKKDEKEKDDINKNSREKKQGRVNFNEGPFFYNQACCTEKDKEDSVKLNDSLIRQLYPKLLDYRRYLGMYNSLLPLSFINGRLNPVPKYRSEWLDNAKVDPPVTYTYEVLALKDKVGCDTAVDVISLGKNTYNIAKRRHIILSAGFAYTFGDVSETKVEKNDDGTIKTITNEQKSQSYVFGFKIFPWQGLWLGDKKFIKHKYNPKSYYGKAWQRVSFFGGFRVSKNPLNDIFIGAGYDLVPGFNINFGAHFANTKNYEIANNRVISEKENYKSPLPYAAINIDPEVLVRFLLFTGKTIMK